MRALKPTHLFQGERMVNMSRFSLVKNETQYKLSQETAESAVQELIQFYGVDVDALPDRKQQRSVEAAMSKLVDYYRMGLLENVRDGAVMKVKQHFANPPGDVREITYGQMSGKHKLASDGYDEDDRYARIYAILGSLAGLPDTAISALSGVDLSAAEDLGLVFLLG
jgi:ABC-type Fe2+-enterobactin transport system substrate-binding protein